MRTFAQSPVHAANFQPFAGTARSVSRAPPANVLPQRGTHVMVPFPVFPSATGTRTGPKVADTATGLLRVSEHDAWPVHAPPQPTNRRPAAGSSVSAVWLPPSHCVVHDDAQARPG